MKKRLQEIQSDQDAEAFLEQDLSADLSAENFTRVSFEFLPKTKKVNMRFPEPLLAAVQKKARQEGISYQKYIRRAIERSLGAS
jgi:predicted DNA binding CopG/RHH family protein